jgi:hypothetical protein
VRESRPHLDDREDIWETLCVHPRVPVADYNGGPQHLRWAHERLTVSEAKRQSVAKAVRPHLDEVKQGASSPAAGKE